MDAGVFVADLARELSTAAYAVSVLCPDIRREKSGFPGLKVRWFPWAGGDRKLNTFRAWNPADLMRLLSLFRRGTEELSSLHAAEGFEHCLAMWAVPSGYLAWRLRRDKGVPYSVWVLGSDIWTYARIPLMRGLIRRVLRDADHVFADGVALRTEAEKISGRNCVYLRSSRRLPLDGLLQVPVDRSRRNLLYVGRWEGNKGIDLLVAAAAELLKGDVDFDLHVFGAGSLESRIRKIAAEPGVRDRIKIGGYASVPMLASYLSACDAIVLPSRKESFAVVLSDAFQVGTPAIVTNVGDMGRIITEYGAGTVAPTASVAGIKEAITEFLAADREAFTRRLGVLREQFSIEAISRELTGYLEQAGPI